MIVTDQGESWRLITQPDHARFSGQLLRLWRDPELAEHPRRGEIVFAGREHDNGWREADAAPSWDGERGRPHDFQTLPPAPRIELWLRGTARFAGDQPYATLLVCLHALNFYRRGGDEAWDGMVETIERRRDELLETTGTDLGRALADYRFVRFADAASLAVCTGDREPFTDRVPADRRAVAPGVTAAGTPAAEREIRGRFDPETATLHLEPLPLAGATRFEIPIRTLPRRRYAGDADLGGELAAARWSRTTVRVAS